MFIASSTECLLSDNSSSSFVYPPPKGMAQCSVFGLLQNGLDVSYRLNAPYTSKGVGYSTFGFASKQNPKSFGFLKQNLHQANLIIISTASILRSLCPAGAYCPAQSAVPVPCPVGHWCPKGSAEPHPCPVKHYCSTAGKLEAYTLFQVRFKMYQLTC